MHFESTKLQNLPKDTQATLPERYQGNGKIRTMDMELYLQKIIFNQHFLVYLQRK